MWNCQECIHKDKLGDKQGICLEKCKDVFSRLNRENHCYQEIVPKPLNCGDCQYLEGGYCKVMNWDQDDRYIFFKPVRANYLTKNTPKWCQLK